MDGKKTNTKPAAKGKKPSDAHQVNKAALEYLIHIQKYSVNAQIIRSSAVEFKEYGFPSSNEFETLLRFPKSNAGETTKTDLKQINLNENLKSAASSSDNSTNLEFKKLLADKVLKSFPLNASPENINDKNNIVVNWKTSDGDDDAELAKIKEILQNYSNKIFGTSASASASEQIGSNMFSKLNIPLFTDDQRDAEAFVELTTNPLNIKHLPNESIQDIVETNKFKYTDTVTYNAKSFQTRVKTSTSQNNVYNELKRNSANSMKIMNSTSDPVFSTMLFQNGSLEAELKDAMTDVDM